MVDDSKGDDCMGKNMNFRLSNRNYYKNKWVDVKNTLKEDIFYRKETLCLKIGNT
jgi:hypothetical protein